MPAAQAVSMLQVGLAMQQAVAFVASVAAIAPQVVMALRLRPPPITLGDAQVKLEANVWHVVEEEQQAVFLVASVAAVPAIEDGYHCPAGQVIPVKPPHLVVSASQQPAQTWARNVVSCPG